MTATVYPLPRETRESAILAGNGTVGPFGPSLYKIFDTVDVKVFAKALGETFYSDVTAGCTIAKVNPASAYDYFTVTFGTSVPTTTAWYHQARRIAERSVAVTRGGTLDSNQLEKELSKEASVESEVRRDINRAVSVDPGTNPIKVKPGAAGELMVGDAAGNIVGSGTTVAGLLSSVSTYASAAAALATAAAGSATSAATSATAADVSADAAAGSAAAAAAAAAAVNFPEPVADTVLLRNSGNTAYVPQNKTQFKTWLAASAADISFLQTGTGAQTTTIDGFMKAMALSIFDFMTPAQIADVRARTQTLDVSASVLAWFTACLAQKKAGYAPGGLYRCDSPGVFDGAATGTTGFTIFGDGVQNTLFNYTGSTVPAYKLICSGGSPSAPATNAYAKVLGIGFAASVNGQVFQLGAADGSDLMNLTRLEIWLANNSTGASATLIEVNNQYGGHIHLNGSTASTPRTILTLGAITGGSGYVNGTYTNVPLTGGNGGYATANITVSGGAVTAVTLVNGGYGYNAAEALSASNTKLGGSGSGFSIPVGTVRTTTSCGIRLRQCDFTDFFVSISGVNRAIYITDGASYGNTFHAPDLEIVDYGVVIDSANAVNNTFIGGQWHYYSFGVSAAAGEDNVFINPHIAIPAFPFISTGSFVGVYEFGSRTMTVRGAAKFGSAPIPTTNDGAALGSATNQWSDLFMASGGVVNFANGNYTVTHTSGTLTFSGAVLSSGSSGGGVGYATGAGGAVTQLTSRTTGVTLNKPSGDITLFSAAGTGTPQKFVVTNSEVAATDTISLSQLSGTNDYIYHIVRVAAGSFTVMFWTAGVATDSPVFHFNVFKGKNS